MFKRRLELEGRKFGKITVISWADDVSKWLCECDCGSRHFVRSSPLVKGSQVSCGCYNREKARKRKWATHGMAGSPTYRTWCSMLARCRNPNATGFNQYGGRGIEVCESWHSFENFYAVMGEKPEGLSLDRIDFNGNYEPDNCRWANVETQAVNRRGTRFIEFDGEVMAISQWARKLGITQATLYTRLRKGWSVKDAFVTDIQYQDNPRHIH